MNSINSMAFTHLSNHPKTVTETHLASKPVTDRAYQALEQWGFGKGLRPADAIRKIPRSVLMAFWTVVGNEAVRFGRQLTHEDIRNSFKHYYAAARIIASKWLKESVINKQQESRQQTFIENENILASAEVRRLVGEVSRQAEERMNRVEAKPIIASTSDEFTPLEQAAREVLARNEIKPNNPTYEMFVRAAENAKRKIERKQTPGSHK